MTAKASANAMLSGLVERFDAAGGARAELAADDMECDPTDESDVDPLQEGLKQIALQRGQQSSPPTKRAKDHEQVDGRHPIERLRDLSASLGLEPWSADFAAALDARDALAPFRNEFCIPKRPGGDQPGLYFVGNSLGLMPRTARARVNEELDAWEAKGVEGTHTESAKQSCTLTVIRPLYRREALGTCR